MIENVDFSCDEYFSSITGVRYIVRRNDRRIFHWEERLTCGALSVEEYLLDPNNNTKLTFANALSCCEHHKRDNYGTQIVLTNEELMKIYEAREKFLDQLRNRY